MFGVDIFYLVYYSLIANTIINIFMMFLNKDFRNGNHISDLAQLRGLWVVFIVLTPFFLFPKVISILIPLQRLSYYLNQYTINSTPLFGTSLHIVCISILYV